MSVRILQNGLAPVLAGGVSLFLANELWGWVADLWPAVASGLPKIAILGGMLVAFGAASWLVLRWLLPYLAIAIAVVFWPESVAQQLPTALALESQRDDDDDSILRLAARLVMNRLVRPGLHGIVGAFETVHRSMTRHTEEIDQALHRMNARWVATNPFEPIAAAITYVDPVHGTIDFGPEFSGLLMHPLVQRLNEIRQLTFAFPKYPGGTHTRFNHSVGVAYLARSAVKRVLDADVVYTAKGLVKIELSKTERDRLVKLATVGGLVHDLAHPPLGHTLDRFFRTRYFEGDATSDADKSFLPRLLNDLAEPIKEACDCEVEEVKRVLLTGTDLSGWDVFLSELLNSRLDVDRIDYLQRDAHFTGQREGLLNIEALLAALRPFQEGDDVFLTFDELYLSDVEQFVYARDIMYLRCYEHNHKVVSEALARRFVKRLFDENESLSENLIAFARLTDTQLIDLIGTFLKSRNGEPPDAPQSAFRSGALAYREVDSARFDIGNVEGQLAALLSDFMYESKILLDKVEELEREIANAAGTPTQDVVVVLPDPKANEDRAAGLNVKILMKNEEGGYRATPIINDKNDASPSEVLRRRKYVSKEQVDTATNLEDLKKLAAEGISLLRIISDARVRIRLFLHDRSWGKVHEVRNAFRSQGIRSAGQSADGSAPHE